MAAVDRAPYSSDLGRVIQAGRARNTRIRASNTASDRPKVSWTRARQKTVAIAVSWLRIAHDIYVQHNRQAEWQAYLAGLLDMHARKYKLVPMLRGIR